MSVGETLPPVDLTSAAIDAINIILTELHISPLQILLGLFSGKPKFEDTENVIAAYNQSAYWPLHALAADMQIWVNNGAPISDSNPAVQATFGAAKQGTVESIQGLAGVQQGPSGPGYWTIFQLIELSWKASGDGEQAVLQYVKALDALTQVLSEQKPPSTPPPPGTPPPGTPPPVAPPPCDSGNPDADEILDLCNAVNGSLAAILAALNNLGPGQTTGAMDPCCVAVVNKLTHVIRELTIIATALTFESKHEQTIDLAPITAALQALVTAVAEYPPALQACCAAISNNLTAIATSLGPDLGKVIQNIADAINKGNAMADVPQAIIDAVAKTGLVNAQDAQLAGGGPWAWINTLLHDEWRKLNHPPSPEEVNALKADPVFGPGATAALTGKPMPAFKEVLKTTPSVIGEMLLKLFQVVMEGTFDAGKLVMQPAIKQMLQIHQKAIAGMINVRPGDEVNTASTLLTEAATFGFAAHWAAYAAELVDPGKHVGLNTSAGLLAELAGFAELVKGIIGVEVRQAISLPHTYKINAQARAMVPAMGAAMALMARRKISQTTAETLLSYAGLSLDYVPAVEAGAYRPIQPRALVNLLRDQPVNRADLVALLEDAALSPVNVQSMADKIIYNSDANVRNSYLSSLVSGYGKGVVSDQELADALTQFNFSPQAKQYVTSHVLILRREALAAEAEKTVVPLVANGNITPQVGLQQLLAAGVQDWYATLQIDLATTRATIHGIKLQAEAARHLAVAREREAQRAAVAQFEDGTINAAGLSAALLLAGIDPLIAGMVVSVETAKQAGRMRVVYNQLLPPLQAKVLVEQVAAIEQQAKDQLITLGQAAAQLQALNIDAPEIEALVARWAATLKKSPGAAVLLTP